MAGSSPREAIAECEPPVRAPAAGAGAANPILGLRGVGKRFPSGLEALSGIDLSVSRGEFLSLLGPSGCGKSTLLRIIAGLTPPSAGDCRLMVDHAPGRIGFVFQDPTLMPWSTVIGNVLLPFRIAGQRGGLPRDKAHAAVRAVGLAGFEDAIPPAFGGMRMRVLDRSRRWSPTPISCC